MSRPPSRPEVDTPNRPAYEGAVAPRQRLSSREGQTDGSSALIETEQRWS